MKVSTSFLALVGAAHAHYNFPSMISGGKTTTAWDSVRQWTGYYTFDPVTDVTSTDIRCNVGGNAIFANSTLPVTAGSTVGFTANPDIYHPGPLLVYMAKVPTGKTAADWDGSGSVWFKIAAEGPIFGATLSWPTDSAASVSFKIPADTPNGDYLLRVEHIGLHVAQSKGAAQFYISCGQVTVTGGGSGTPGPLVAFPGAYSATDPGILINIYSPVPTSYTMPGPAIWSGGAAASDPAPASSAAPAPAPAPTTSVAVSKPATTLISSVVAAPSPSGATVAKYGQCGGTGWTGATQCVVGTTCKASGTYYSQCL